MIIERIRAEVKREAISKNEGETARLDCFPPFSNQANDQAAALAAAATGSSIMP